MTEKVQTDGLAPILVVDDDPSIVRALCRLIEKVCPAVGATTIAEANEKIEQAKRLTGLILDVHLAEGSGWEVLVTARVRDPFLPAMMLTGMRWESLSQQAKEFHAIPCEKPLEPGDAVRFAEGALRSQETSAARITQLVQELADRCRLSSDEVNAVLASVKGQLHDMPPISPHGPAATPKTLTAHLLSKTGAKSIRDLRDSILRAYFAT
jgi:DNA-binding NtrC family response regulator